jgi:hypothetical protein
MFKLDGQWASDNSAQMTIAGGTIQSGASIANGDPPGTKSFGVWHPFTIFLEPGKTPAITFVVNNSALSAMGLRVEWAASMSVVPEAPTYIAGIGLLAILGFGWMLHPSRMSTIKSS